MNSKNSDRIRSLLKGIETGDPASVAVIDPDTYIQHNPQTHEGREGLAALFQRLSKSNPRVNVVRAFDDGDFVFAHTEYDFDTRRIGFEVFRFEHGFAVEHWDNIQPRQGPNPSGRSMVDGPTEATDLEQTEANRDLVQAFVQNVLIDRQLNKLDRYVEAESLTQHNPHIPDGVPALCEVLEAKTDGELTTEYVRLHRVLAEGDFVLSVSEGAISDAPSAYYDLFRVREGKITEHWDTIEAIPSRNEWKNDNGKF